MKTEGVLFCYLIGSLLYIDSLARNRKELERSREMRVIDTNLCTMQGNSADLHCVCVGGNLPVNASSVECWVFTRVSKEHVVWNLFGTQPYILELKILVRPNGIFGFVPTKALKFLKNLKVLEITYATIEEIHPYAFANSSSLIELKLANNRIATLQHHSFSHLPNLLEVNLDENKITELSRDVFIDLPNLQKLFIVQNKLSFIQEGTFRHLAHLVELELYANYINVLTRDTFTGLSGLKRLDLSNNKISMLGDLTFSELWILEDLQLESNLIEFISDRAFAGLTHLKRLGMGNNRISSLSGNLMSTIPAVNHLDLRDNNLETIALDTFKPIMNNFCTDKNSLLYLDGNKFVCNCTLGWMYAFKNETKNLQVKNTLDELTCFMGSSEEPEIVTALSKIGLTEIERNDMEMNGDIYTKISVENGVDDDNMVYGLHYVTLPPTKDPRRRQLFEIPQEELPCPQEAPKTSDAYQNTPEYEEIRTSTSQTSSSTFLPILVGIVTFIIIIM